MPGVQPVTVTRHISAPVDRVWAVATDIPAAPDVLSGVDRIEMLTDTPFGVGTRWRETRTIMKRSATEEMWVSAVRQPDSYTVEADSRGAHYVSVFSFTPTGDGGTDVSLSFEGRPKGLPRRVMARMLGRLAAGSVKSALRADLDDIARAAERQPA